MPQEDTKETGGERAGSWSAQTRAGLARLAPHLVLFIIVFMGVISATVVAAMAGAGYTAATGESDASGEAGIPSSCNVVALEIRGCLATYAPVTSDGVPDPASGCDTITSSEDVVWALEEARWTPHIKAVLLEVDSGGGSPAAAEEIAASLKALGKPSVAWVRESAASAAYWVASAADTIIASKSSDIGSIGVTYSYVDNAKQNEQEGLTYNQLTTGKYKDTGTLDRLLTNDERALIERDLDITLQNFIAAVAANRHLPVEKVQTLADGSSMLGQMALEEGLIDALGNKQEVWQELAAAIGAEPNVCWPL